MGDLFGEEGEEEEVVGGAMQVVGGVAESTVDVAKEVATEVVTAVWEEGEEGASGGGGGTETGNRDLLM